MIRAEKIKGEKKSNEKKKTGKNRITLELKPVTKDFLPLSGDPEPPSAEEDEMPDEVEERRWCRAKTLPPLPTELPVRGTGMPPELPTLPLFK